ncbi:hypothetical protein PtA15_8A113 [Puccinia triticina]|uniref:Uncharacterized protein n=1 Tax=Puccinia triticina TaxID=208348 RepID=A0ABY7CTB5_9BASI|nr:uncharacterized protein PtA15_8A113 [Puccinia triticina]WAQ87212.1 hypothetical protein PtA15_8A113 [Puccinia triticina]WAR57060.1 hypothetical protein PtB15_8B104 [Puccinia triticina]
MIAKTEDSKNLEIMKNTIYNNMDTTMAFLRGEKFLSVHVEMAFESRYLYGKSPLKQLSRQYLIEAKLGEEPSSKMIIALNDAIEELFAIQGVSDESAVQIGYYGHLFCGISGINPADRTPFNQIIISHIKQRMESKRQQMGKYLGYIYNAMKEVWSPGTALNTSGDMGTPLKEVL